MQRLARHSTVELTLGRYTHAGLYDLTSAVKQLPSLPVQSLEQSEAVTLQMTVDVKKYKSVVAPIVAKTC